VESRGPRRVKAKGMINERNGFESPFTYTLLALMTSESVEGMSLLKHVCIHIDIQY
jgi:hypothetical protein